MKFNIEIVKTKEGHLATCPELEINCYADTQDSALRRIKEVIKFYIHSAREMGFEVNTSDSFLLDGEIIPVSDPSISAIETSSIN